MFVLFLRKLTIFSTVGYPVAKTPEIRAGRTSYVYLILCKLAYFPSFLDLFVRNLPLL